MREIRQVDGRPEPLGRNWRDRNRTSTTAIADAWSGWIGRIPWTVFATLTFDPSRVFPVTRERASRKTFAWVNLAGYLTRRPVAWVYVVEQGRTGLWHAHAVATGVSAPQAKVLTSVWRARNGHADARKVVDGSGIALYMTKDVGKSEVVLSDTLTATDFSNLPAGSVRVHLDPLERA